MTEADVGSIAAGRRLLLTCAMTRYKYCQDWNREELTHDVDRIARLFCGDFLPPHARYEHVTVLGDSPTSVQLLDRLRDFCTSPQRRTEDYVVVYLTGHGEILDDGNYVILAHDTRPEDLQYRTVPASELIRLALAGTRVRRLLLLLDTCYSGKGGADLAREALLRLDQPEPASDGDSPPSAGGVVVVAATHPYEQALPGIFTTCLDQAARSLATAGNAPPTLRVGALIGQVNADPAKPLTQSSEWHQLRMDDDEPAFLPNPRYRPPLVDVDLLEQERARHNEQRERQLQERFLPATRWFTGRHSALIDLADWLKNSKNQPSACVVTGNAGSGKTALLGLITALSDPDQAPGVSRQGLPVGFAIPSNAINEAIYAGTMTTAQIRDRIADAAALRVETVQELIRGLNQRTGPPLTVLVDALDEAADHVDLVMTLLNHLIRRCAHSIRLLLGTRPHLLSAKLLGKPTDGQYQMIDLDSRKYADPESIRDYTRRILLSTDTLDSAYTPSGIYQTASAEFVDLVTAAIAEAADKSFLIARITATTEATVISLPNPADTTWRASLPRRAGEAMRRDLNMRLGSNAQKAADLLLPLAYSQGSGMPWEDIWPRLADALSPGNSYSNRDLVWLRTAAGSYAVEGVADGRSVYRLYHQALVEHLRTDRDEMADQRIITEVLLAQVPVRVGGQRDWFIAHPYTRTHLATHAAGAVDIENLATDPGFLLAAAPLQLVAALDSANSKSVRRIGDAYRRAARHLRRKHHSEHASYLQLAARCSHATDLAEALDAYTRSSAWSARWAWWQYRPPRYSLTGHTDRINAVAVAELDSRPVVVTASADQTVRVWEVATGAPVGFPFTGHTSWVNAIAIAELNGRPVAITGSDDSTVQVWELATGERVGSPIPHTSTVNAVAIAKLNGRQIIISAAAHTIRAWDLTTGSLVSRAFSDKGWIYAIAVTDLDDRPVVIGGSDYSAVQVWDLETGTPVGTPFTGHTDRVNSVAVSELHSRPVVISASSDHTVQMWDLHTRAAVAAPFTGHTGSVRAVTVTKLDDRPVAISGAADHSVQVWDLESGALLSAPFVGHNGWVKALTVTELDDRLMVISGSSDHTVKIWDLGIGAPVSGSFISHAGRTRAATTTELHNRPVVISNSDDGSVQVWDLDSGDRIGDPFPGVSGGVWAMKVTELYNRPMLLVGSANSAQIWDLNTRTRIGHSIHFEESAHALAVAHLDGQLIMICSFFDHAQMWDLAGRIVGELPIGRVVAVGELENRAVVIFEREDNALRVWDLTRRGPARNSRRAIALRYSAPILSAAIHQDQDRLHVVASCGDGTIWTSVLSSGHIFSDKRHYQGTAVTGIAFLGSERLVLAAGGALVVDSIAQSSTTPIRIELESEVLALATYDKTTVAVVTGLGLVVLDIP